MESAIPAHLETDRTRHRRVQDDYEPPYPAFVARFKPNVKRVVMGYFGIQYRGDPPISTPAVLDWIAGRFASENGPSHWDQARYVDEGGFVNFLSVAYWDQRAQFDAWFSAVHDEWIGDHHLGEGLGRFIEVLAPSIEGLETIFSSPAHSEGVTVLANAMSDEIQEHGYWGGMRDRIPLSQTNAMTPEGSPRLIRDGSRIRVIAHDNLCLIRSGQDWSDMEGVERKMYLEDIEPVLKEGMDFLRDEGLSIGCYANRYVNVLVADGSATEKSYGMSWWKSLAELERWAESHPTHVKIFGAAMKYYSTLGPAAKLRLYHEVSVARSDEQFFEYLNCHNQTGMLKSIDRNKLK
jgi:aldoxime dehydratase